jgi:hypothetical protein
MLNCYIQSMDVNGLLGSPTGVMVLRTIGTVVSYDHKIVTEGPGGCKRTHYIPIPTPKEKGARQPVLGAPGPRPK